MIWIILLLTYVGKFHTGSFTRPRGLLALGTLSLLLAFVLLLSSVFQHLFFHSPLAVNVLSWFQSIMFLASPLCPSILVPHVVFGFSADELSVVPQVFVYMLSVGKFCIWGAWNNFRFRGVSPSAVDVMERVKSRVRFNLPFFFCRFRSDRRGRYFVRQWGARGVVASLHNDALVLDI